MKFIEKLLFSLWLIGGIDLMSRANVTNNGFTAFFGGCLVASWAIYVFDRIKN